MPWVKYASATATAPNPSCTETVLLLKLYDNDIKGCKFHVNVASDAPENIPGSQWERIFKGEPVDLSQILSSLHRITLDEQQSLLARLNHLRRFPLRQNGLLLGAALRGPSCSPFHTAPASLMTMETTSRANSLRSTPLLTNASYGMTLPSGM